MATHIADPNCYSLVVEASVSLKEATLYYVYVIQSLQVRYRRRSGRALEGFYYVGMTTSPARRLREHNGLYANGEPGNPKGSKYTSKHRPWLLRAIYGPFNDRSEALQAEYALKRGKRGASRARWTPTDSHWCRGDGPSDPRIGECNQWVRQQLGIDATSKGPE